MKRVRFSWTLFEIGVLTLVIAVLAIASTYLNHQERGLALSFLLVAFFLIAISMLLRRIENSRIGKQHHSDLLNLLFK